MQCHLSIADQLHGQLCCFCHVLISNCGREGVQWVLETNHLYYNYHGHVGELVFLVIKHFRSTM